MVSPAFAEFAFKGNRFFKHSKFHYAVNLVGFSNAVGLALDLVELGIFIV